MPRPLAVLFALAPALVQAQTPDALTVYLFLNQLPPLTHDSVLCAKVDGADVSPLLLEVLRKQDDRFVRARECVYVMDVDKGSYHAKSGRPAYFVSVSNFKDLPNGTAEVKFDMRHHGLWGIHKNLLVRLDNGKWHVIKVEREWDNWA